MSDTTVVANGIIEDIIYHNHENGYAVFSIKDSEETEITCVGYVPQLHTGESIKITGRWVVHPTYGKQLQVEFFEKTIPTTQQGMEKYLCSGVIRGIGPKTAKKIVQRFGDATFYVIEEKPDRLVEIKGITYEKALMINQVFMEQFELRKAMLFLQDFGISPAYAMKIFKRYKGRTFDVVKNNPYRLADDIFGIGFKMADRLAAHSGIAVDSPHRIKAGIKYMLNYGVSAGHVYLPRNALIDKTKELLDVPRELIENSLRDLQIEHQIWQEDLDGTQAVYLSNYYYAELSVAKKLIELSQEFEFGKEEDLELQIKIAERIEKIHLAENQRIAVKEAMTNGLLIITGGPGTGKTTTINTIIRIMKDNGLDIILAAPTGRAAKRMTEATGMEAQTIHRLLGISFGGENIRQQIFDKNEDDPIDADVIIIDETSMVDILLMNSLLKAIRPGSRVIFAGDADQLPSVGAGNVLKDMIYSERLRVVRLTEIFRQAQESAIVMNAHRINHGEEPVMNEKDKDFFFMKRAYSEEVVETICQLCTKRLPLYTGCDPIQEIQVLTPMRKGPVGVQHLNQMLQTVLNPPDSKKKEKELRNNIFREGDKVMQIKNNYNIAWKIVDTNGMRLDEGIGVFNGDEGIILKINEEKETMTVLFDDNKQVEYDYTQLDELELAYAITIHKSQGSEYPVVILPLHSGPELLMSRNLLYTAVTRAKKLVVIVGVQDTVSRMIQNKREINRYSTLAKRIVNLYDFMYQEITY